MSDFRQQALDYHSKPVPGKIAIQLTKPAESVTDLALAYSPGVAEPVREIAADPNMAYKYTGKGNLVAVITNGTAILGLGNLGPLASKPVMEGKALLFKRFADIDSIDIEVKHRTTEDFINTVANIADTFGGINLEDIKAPAGKSVRGIGPLRFPRDFPNPEVMVTAMYSFSVIHLMASS